MTVHSYNENKIDEGEPKMGTSYDDKMRPVRSTASQNDSESDDDEYVPDDESEDEIGW